MTDWPTTAGLAEEEIVVVELSRPSAAELAPPPPVVVVVVVVGVVADPLKVDPESWALMASPELGSVNPPLHWAQLTGLPWYMESNTTGPL